MKQNKHGFKVYASNQVYVGEQTIRKSAPREEVVELCRNVWNTHPSVKAIRKHVRRLTIQKMAPSSSKWVTTGRWIGEDEAKCIVNDYSSISAHHYKETMLHELVGHAFWEWARKWRNEEWIAFNEYVKTLKPINSYVQKEGERFKTIPQYGFSLYENEQHSAAVEIFENCTGKEMYLNEEEIEELRKYYNALHYIK